MPIFIIKEFIKPFQVTRSRSLGFFNGIRLTSTIFVCTTSVKTISNSPDCLLSQGFHLHLEDLEGHGLLADQEHQEYQKVPAEREQHKKMKREWL